jgi:hypothetical protein
MFKLYSSNWDLFVLIATSFVARIFLPTLLPSNYVFWPIQVLPRHLIAMMVDVELLIVRGLGSFNERYVELFCFLSVSDEEDKPLGPIKTEQHHDYGLCAQTRRSKLLFSA